MESELVWAQQALAASGKAWRKAEEEANRLTDEQVSLLLELEASKDELFTFRVEASKEKQALEEEFDAGFEVIFNYGNGCCAFAHNICGSKPRIPVGMPDTSKSLPYEFFFFINPRCPLSAVLGVPATDPDVNIREELLAESLLAADERLSVQSDSLAKVVEENEEPDASGGS